jgi:hypothetical protein
VALAQKSPMKVVLMDELGVLDENNKQKLLERMILLSNNGEIDLFVGADVSAGLSKLHDINVIML